MVLRLLPRGKHRDSYLYSRSGMSRILGCSNQPSPQPCLSISRAASLRKGTVDKSPDSLTASGVYSGNEGLAHQSFWPLQPSISNQASNQVLIVSRNDISCGNRPVLCQSTETLTRDIAHVITSMSPHTFMPDVLPQCSAVRALAPCTLPIRTYILSP